MMYFRLLAECSASSHPHTGFYDERKGIPMGFFSKFFSKTNNNLLYAPVAGKAIPVTEVPDPTFAEEMLGKGIAVEPTDGKVYAPCDGTVATMFDTGHAVTLEAKNGAEVLIHVGLETVNLGGKHFKTCASTGDTVKKGDLLIDADLAAIKAEGYDTVTMMVVCNSDEFSTFNTNVGVPVTNSDVVIELGK